MIDDKSVIIEEPGYLQKAVKALTKVFITSIAPYTIKRRVYI